MTSEEQDRLLDELLKECKSPEDILGKHGLLRQLTKRAVERALAGEMTAHLGYEPHERGEQARENTRNGKTAKTVLSESGAIELEVPRDRDGSFEPKLVRKRQRRLEGFDEKVIALYARGLTTREIQGHLEELYGVEVSPALISAVTEQVAEEERVWQSRGLDALYPIIYFDALFVKTRQTGPASLRAVYLALGITREGRKELLGLWAAATEGAKFWLGVLTELQARGLKDCFVACVDGLTGFAEALQAVYPRTAVQLCIVHKVRNSLRYVPWKARKAVAADLRTIYSAPSLKEAETALERFAETWDAQYPTISRSWRKDWAALSTFFDYPPQLRKVLYTTNAIESLNYSLRRVLKNRGAFPDDDSVLKVLHLAIERAAKKWTMPIHDWPTVVNRFVIMFGERMTLEEVTQKT
jgi:putative transposase